MNRCSKTWYNQDVLVAQLVKRVHSVQRLCSAAALDSISSCSPLLHVVASLFPVQLFSCPINKGSESPKIYLLFFKKGYIGQVS